VEEKTPLAAALRQARINAGLTQEELARRIDVRAVAVSRWERGVHQPGLDRLQRIAEATRTPIETFMESL
jgi:transcriptional regulator with XRE-family HTH domain